MSEVTYVTSAQFDAFTVKLFTILERFDQRLTIIEKLVTNIEERLTNIEQRVTSLELRVGQIEVALEEIKENLSTLSDAEGKDAMASMNHERRIAVLERRGGIQPHPPQHLLEIE